MSNIFRSKKRFVFFVLTCFVALIMALGVLKRIAERGKNFDETEVHIQLKFAVVSALDEGPESMGIVVPMPVLDDEYFRVKTVDARFDGKSVEARPGEDVRFTAPLWKVGERREFLAKLTLGLRKDPNVPISTWERFSKGDSGDLVRVGYGILVDKDAVGAAQEFSYFRQILTAKGWRFEKDVNADEKNYVRRLVLVFKDFSEGTDLESSRLAFERGFGYRLSMESVEVLK